MANVDPRLQPPVQQPGAVPPQQPVPQQPAVQQPVYITQPTAYPPPQYPVQQPPQPVQQPPQEEGHHHHDVEEREGTPVLTLISHSDLYYWWPVWAVGYLMALLTRFQGHEQQVGNYPEWFHPSSSLGLIFFFVLLLVVLIMNVQVRGLASGMVILGIILVVVLLAYFDWLETVLSWIGHLSVHMNMGAYVFIATAMFVIWASAVFVFDRMDYWQIKPGQITHVHVFGAGSESYDTDNMILEKHRDNIFRHWVLGLGSGDLKVQTAGANRQDIYIPNVLFIGRKVEIFQRMIATKPDAFPNAMIR